MKHSLKRECLRHLQDTFGLEDYRPGQKAAVQALLSGRDVMCILPTGAGKSLCWQLPALVHEGLTIVVSPLIALMRDQVQHLSAIGVAAISLDSLMEKQEREEAIVRIRSGGVRIVYVSPERLEHRQFRRLCCEMNPWLVVVDEAHCVVQWGEGFRPSYRNIAEFISSLPKRPVLCALTATADKGMQRAIREALSMCRAKRVLLPIIRENLVYNVRTTLDRTSCIIRQALSSPCKTVIFCRTRARAESLTDILLANGIAADYYHAGLDREVRILAQQRFLEGTTEILCATTAFGMGIDISDIRRVIHDEIPDNVIDYVQQSGRAGRDGLDAECIVYLEPRHLVNRADMRRKTKDKQSWDPIHRWMDVRKQRRKLRKLLNVLLTSECIAVGILRAFGQRGRSCGRCAACRNGALLTHVPDIGGMREYQVRAFLLKWQRDALAAKRNLPPQELMPDADLMVAAKKFVFPSDASAPDEMARLLVHFRHERAHDSGSEWIT